MFTLMMILVVAWVITRWIGAGSCSYDRNLSRARRESWRLDEGNASPGRHVAAGQRATERSGGARSVSMETPLEKLQRQFASGAITMEQYEHEVGKLYGVRGEA